jgi:hypothetical protein
MHRILPVNAKVSQKHAQIAKKHGHLLAAIAKELQQFTDENSEEIQKILELGQSIQDHAEASERYAAIAEHDDERSTEAYVLAAQEHVLANEKHVKAVREYLKLVNQSPRLEISDS